MTIERRNFFFAAWPLCDKKQFSRKVAETQSLSLIMDVLIFLACLTISIGSTTAQQDSRDKQLSELADAERAFAAYTVKEGFRNGFIKFFADDGIGFGPHPERTRENLIKSPPQTGPRKVVFNWAPMFGDISEAGDLGYTTGPVLYTDVTENPRPPRHGMYFSVWQKQSDGTWRVVVDMGTDTPNAVATIDTKFTAANPVGPRKLNPMRGTPGDSFRERDIAIFSSLARTRRKHGGLEYLDSQFRIHRRGMMPIVDEPGLALLPLSLTRFDLIDGKVAKSDDLAFTYGKYTATFDQQKTETGYYVHVWRRDAESKWRLVIDVQNPLPAADK
ncbi:MAG: nuclear transport factor 2 family protein [Pyrinomonadaceae bacterium]